MKLYKVMREPAKEETNDLPGITDFTELPGLTPPTTIENGSWNTVIPKYKMKVKRNGSYSYQGGKTGGSFKGKIQGFGGKTNLIQRGDILEDIDNNIKYRVLFISEGTLYKVLDLEEVS